MCRPSVPWLAPTLTDLEGAVLAEELGKGGSGMVVRAVQHGEVRLAAKILRMERAGVECFKQHRLAFENEAAYHAIPRPAF